MDQGRDLRDKGDLKEALKRFQAANEIMHVPTTALEVAKAQVALGLLVEARDTVAALRQIPGDQDSSVFKDARARAEELDSSLSGRVPALTITLKGADPGQDTELAVDGVRVPTGVLGLPRSVDPGHHVITAKTKSGAGSVETDVREGEQKPVEIELIATAPDSGSVPPPSPSPEEPEPPAKVHSPTVLTVVGIAVAGAGVVAGSVTGLVSLSKKSTLTSQCANHVCGPPSYSTLDSANTFATVSDVSFAIAGAGAALAIVTLIVGYRPTPTASVAPATGWTVVPWIAGSEAGIRGSF